MTIEWESWQSGNLTGKYLINSVHLLHCYALVLNSPACWDISIIRVNCSLRESKLKINEATDFHFSEQPGYYRDVVVPKMYSTDLIGWLRETNLIPKSQSCPNCTSQQMVWTKFNYIRDCFKWQCERCNMTVPIRKNSCFEDLKCGFDDLLRIYNGWCLDYDSDVIAKLLRKNLDYW